MAGKNGTIPDEKLDAVAELTQKFRESHTTVLTEYRGLSVPKLKELRRALGEGASYRVAKNTLAKRAASDAGVTDLDEHFTGPTALTFITGEVVDATKTLRDFSKANQALVIKGGVMEGAPISAEEISKIADLESREVMLAQLAGAMKGNLSKAARLFNEPASKLARASASLRDQKSSEGE